MKIITTAIILGLISTATAENKKAMKKEAKKEIAVSTEKSLSVKDLPEKVQASIKKTVKGEIKTIQKVKADKKLNYKVVAVSDKKNTIHFFDAEGNSIK